MVKLRPGSRTEERFTLQRARVAGRDAQPQPHAPPQQPPPAPGPAARSTPPEAPDRPPTATVDSSLTVSSWPPGHRVGEDDSCIGRLTSKVSPHARHRYS